MLLRISTRIVLLLALGLVGCADTATLPKFNVSGQVLDATGTGLAGVSLALTGAKTETTTTDSAGNFSFADLADGAYTVTPSQPNTAFKPSRTNFTVKGAAPRAIKFSVAPPGVTPAATFKISGRVTDSANAAVSNISLLLSGAAKAQTTTNSAGEYSFAPMAAGGYVVTPEKIGTAFTPLSRNVSLTTAEAPGINFTASIITTPVTTYNLTGRIATADGTAIKGVIVALGGANTASAITLVDGTYAFPPLVKGDYTVTPALTGYVFDPTSKNVKIDAANVTAINFVGTPPSPPTFKLSGRVVTSTGAGIEKVLMTLNPGATIPTDPSGNYAFEKLVDGKYTVSAVLTGYTFVTQSVTIAGADVPNINFTDTPVALPTFKLSGRVVTSTGAGIKDVVMTLNPGATISTDASGNYAFEKLVDGKYTVSAVLAGYTFTAPQSVTVAGADVPSVNFTGTPVAVATYTVSGRVIDKTTTQGVEKVTITLVGVGAGNAPRTTETGTGGNYSFDALASGSYTLTPALTGYTFAALPDVVVKDANITGADFVATATVPTVRNYTLYITTGILKITPNATGAGGADIPGWGFTDDALGAAKFPGPVLTANEGDTVRITVTNQHTLEHNFIIQGLPGDSASIPVGASKTYTFGATASSATALKAGTYLYYDALNKNINRSMGLYGALIVRPAGGGNTAWTEGPAYTFERLWVTSDIDKLRWNDIASVGGSVITAEYKPNYFVINGMGGAAAMDDKTGTAINGRVGDTALVRIINAGQFTQTLHFHSNHVQVISVDGMRQPAPFKLLDVLLVPPRSSTEVLFKLNQVGTYPMHNHTAQMETANGVYLNGVVTKIYIVAP